MPRTRLERSGTPKGWKRLLFRAPIALYRIGLGFLLGQRFLMLEHTGRKTGETRRTVLEVVVNDPDAVYVASGWGRRAQWLRNMQTDPSVEFVLGSRRYRTTAEGVEPGVAARLLDEYASAHPKAIGRLAAFMLDEPGESPGEQARRIAEAVPMIRLAKGVSVRAGGSGGDPKASSVTRWTRYRARRRYDGAPPRNDRRLSRCPRIVD
ncbi:MAG: nitroreductase family deazaflavin-dependent oxidoreductase [Acidimicrobiia bacterium]